MVKAFKNFWKEYFDLCKASGSWLKKHWLGYIILCIVIFVTSFGGAAIYQKIDYMRTKKMMDDMLEEDEEE